MNSRTLFSMVATASVVAWMTVDTLAASWLEVAPFRWINPESVHAVELVTEGTKKSATIALSGERVSTSSVSVVTAIEALTASRTVWIATKGETVGGRVITRHARRSSVLGVQFSCPATTACSAYLSGVDDSFSRLVVDNSGTIAELKRLTSQADMFVMLEQPSTGFESFVRRQAIRGVRFICSQPDVCTQADLTLPSATVRVVRDADGIRRLLELSGGTARKDAAVRR